MTITLPPEIERALAERAQEQGTTPENLALDVLREKYRLPAPQPTSVLEPQDDWERLLFSLSFNCGVSLSNDAVSSEGIYD